MESLPGPPQANNKKRILVTGGTGFIGRALLKQIREYHLDKLIPLSLARPTSNLISLQRLLDYPCSHRTVFVANLQNVESLMESVSFADIIVHLAADMDFHPKHISKLIKTNVEGTRNLLEATARVSQLTSSRKRFLYVSSTEVIGPTDGIDLADEDAPQHPTSPYGQSKVLAETVVKEYRNQLDIVIVRPTGVFGPDERYFFHEFMSMVASGLALMAPSPMTGRLMVTHIDDVVEGLLICSTHSKAVGNTYNLCADSAASFREMVATMSDILSYPRPILYLSPKVGRFLIRLIAPFMNMGKRRTFTYHPQAVDESIEFREYSNAKLRQLGFIPKYTVLNGIEQTLRYELENGGISRNVIPSAIKRGISFVSVIMFTISKIIGGNQRHELG